MMLLLYEGDLPYLWCCVLGIKYCVNSHLDNVRGSVDQRTLIAESQVDPSRSEWVPGNQLCKSQR